MAKKNNTPVREEHSNKVFQTLSFLDQGERKRLQKYLNSPYFNQSKTLLKLGDILLDHIERGRKNFDRHLVWQKIFPGEAYDDINFRKYCSDLLGLVEGYLSHEHLGSNGLKAEISLLDALVQKRIEPLYQSAHRSVVKKLGDQPFNQSGYLDNYLIEKSVYKIRGYDDNVKETKLNIEEMSTYLDVFYCIEKLKIFSVAYSQRRVTDFHYNLNMMDEVLRFVEQYDLNKFPELALSYYSFQILKDEENERHYFNLKESLKKFGALILQKEAIDLFESAMNYCIGRLNKGNAAFLEEYFNLVEIALEQGVFIVNGEITVWRYNNFVAASLRLGKVDWAEKFIESYKVYLPENNRENTYAFNLARVYRYQGKFDKVLTLLRNVEYEDIGYNLISKAMLIITYYELSSFDALDSFNESFRVFLNRHKNIPQQRRRSYLNLLKYTRRLTRIVPGDKAAVEKLRAEINREKAATVNHEWLLEKLGELE